MQDPDPKCRHFVISWHFMAFWHVCQKANCITKSAFSHLFPPFRLFHRIRLLDFPALVCTDKSYTEWSSFQLPLRERSRVLRRIESQLGRSSSREGRRCQHITGLILEHQTFVGPVLSKWSFSRRGVIASIFWVQYVRLLFFLFKYPLETFHDMAYIFLQYTIIKECLTKQIIQEARMKTSLLRQQTTSTSGKDFEPPLLFFRSALFDQFYVHSCSQY